MQFVTFPTPNNTNFNADVPDQNHMGYRNVYRVMPSGIGSNINTSCLFSDGMSMNVTSNAIGSNLSNIVVGNSTSAALTLKASMRRCQLNANSALMANANAWIFANANTVWSGNTLGAYTTVGGGFIYITVFSIDSYANGATAGASNTCFFNGMVNFTTGPTITAGANLDPMTNTVYSMFGVGSNVGATGTLQLIFGPAGLARNTFSCGAGFTLDTTSVYELTLYAPPSGAITSARVRNLTNGAIFAANSGIGNTTPTNTFFQPCFYIQGNTGAGSVTGNAQISLMRMYLESWN